MSNSPQPSASTATLNGNGRGAFAVIGENTGVRLGVMVVLVGMAVGCVWQVMAIKDSLADRLVSKELFEARIGPLEKQIERMQSTLDDVRDAQLRGTKQ